MITPKVGMLIRGLGYITEVGMNKPMWGDELYIRFLCWEDPGCGQYCTVQREVEDNDLITNIAEQKKYFDRAYNDLNESIDYLKTDLEIVKALKNE